MPGVIPPFTHTSSWRGTSLSTQTNVLSHVVAQKVAIRVQFFG